MRHVWLLAGLLVLTITSLSFMFWKIRQMRDDYDASLIHIDDTVSVVQLGAWGLSMTLHLAWLISMIVTRRSYPKIVNGILILGRGHIVVRNIVYATLISTVVWLSTMTDEVYAMKKIGIRDNTWDAMLVPLTALPVLLGLVAASWQMMIFVSQKKKTK